MVFIYKIGIFFDRLRRSFIKTGIFVNESSLVYKNSIFYK